MPISDYDINGDGAINTTDASYLARVILGKETSSLGDVNGDGVKNIRDICKVVSAIDDVIPPDRMIDWTYAGIPGGIPTRTTEHTLANYTTYNTGAVDATSAINTALVNCPTDEVVYLPAGTYLVNGTISMRSHKVLRGAGQDVTILKAGGSTRDTLVYFSDSYFYDELIGSPNTRNIASAVKDSQTVTLASAFGTLLVGDVLLLNQLNDGTEITQWGWKGGTYTENTAAGLPWGQGTRSMGQFVEVTAINGNDVSTNVPIYWTYNASLTPWAYRMTGANMLRYAGLESLTVTQDSAIVYYNIWLEAAQYCWVKDVEVSNVNRDGINVYFLFQSQLTGNYLHTAIGGHGISMAYGFALQFYSCNNLVDDNIVDDLSNGGIAAGTSSANVISYNYFNNIYFDPLYWEVGVPLINHGAFCAMNLWEGNIGYKVHGDDVAGSSGYQTVFRSFSSGYQSDAIYATNAAIHFSPTNHYMNVVGNVLGTSGKSTHYEAVAGGSYSTSNHYIWVLGKSNQGAQDDSAVSSTLLRHGNYDYFTNSTIWDDDISNHTIPDSLYLNAKPSWWHRPDLSDLAWPAIGPDLNPMAGDIPAKLRFEAM